MKVFNSILFLLVVHVVYLSALNYDWSQNIDPYSGLPRRFLTEIDYYFRHGGLETSALNKYIDDAVSDEFLKYNPVSIFDGISWLTCPLCETAAYTMLQGNWTGINQILLKRFLIKLCSKTLYDKPFCTGVITLNMPIFLYIVENNKNLTPKSVCGIIAQPICGEIYDAPEWSIDVHSAKRTVHPKKEKSDAEPLTVVQITDIHYDEKYVVGSKAACTNKPLCCRIDSGTTYSLDDQAGYWGDYRGCDCPLQAIKDAMRHIRDTHPKIDYIYQTGDIVSHNVWDTTKAQINQTVRLISDMFLQVFPDVPLFPILGNHEPQPLDVFAPLEISDSELSTKWLYDLHNDVWSRWLPSYTKETVSAGGFYSVLVKPGFRIIGVNSNVAFIYNWWLLYDARDPYGHLQWLADELLKAEQNNELVHILSHVPTGDETCEKLWSREYRRIINRYADIIVGHFNGHTHYDEFKLFYDNADPLTPTNVAFNGGGLNTWINVNPNYRVYKIDPDTYEVLDYEQWVYNLTEANVHEGLVRPRWYKLYSFKENYQVPSLQPKDLHNLVIRFAHNESLSREYLRYKGKNADPYTNLKCDYECVQNEICRIITTQYFDNTQCDLLLSKKIKNYL